MNRLTQSQILPYKKKLLEQQGNRCGLCNIDMSRMAPRDACLDHDHKTGLIRAVLCRNCNGIEGKIYNLANRGKREGSIEQFVVGLIKYWREHSEGADRISYVYHPTHRTDDEKRLERNRKARLARAKRTAKKTVKRK